MPDEQIYQALRDLRTDMKEGFQKLSDAFEKHEQEDRAVEKRVTIIETQRNDEQAAALRRGTWSGVFAGGAFSLALKILDRWWK